jgi:hypothetical protein
VVLVVLEDHVRPVVHDLQLDLVVLDCPVVLVVLSYLLVLEVLVVLVFQHHRLHLVVPVVPVVLENQKVQMVLVVQEQYLLHQ